MLSSRYVGPERVYDECRVFLELLIALWLLRAHELSVLSLPISFDSW